MNESLKFQWAKFVEILPFIYYVFWSLSLTPFKCHAQTAHANERQQSRGLERSYGRNQHYQQQQSSRLYETGIESDEYVSALPSFQQQQQSAQPAAATRARKPFRTVSSNGVLGHSNDSTKPSPGFAHSEIGALFKEHFPAASSSSSSSHGGQYGRPSAEMKQSSSRSGGGGSLLTASGAAKPRASTTAQPQASTLYSHEDFLAVQAAAFAAIGPGGATSGRKGASARHGSDASKYKL